MTYRKLKVEDKKVTTKFTLCTKTESIKMEHQKYTGASDYKLIKAHWELWAIINDNELLPVKPEAPDQTRVSVANIIRVNTPPLPDQTTNKAAHDAEVGKKQHAKQLRNVAFWAAQNIMMAFGSALEEVQDAWNSTGALTRAGIAREFH